MGEGFNMCWVMHWDRAFDGNDILSEFDHISATHSDGGYGVTGVSTEWIANLAGTGGGAVHRGESSTAWPCVLRIFGRHLRRLCEIIGTSCACLVLEQNIHEH